MDQTLYVIDTILTSVLAVNKKIITNMIDAAENRVTPSLFPVQDLIHTITLGHSNYSFQPLYTQEGLVRSYLNDGSNYSTCIISVQRGI